MARYNYLIQRHIGGADGANANCSGTGATWRDCGTSEYRHKDEFGNTGYGDRALALAHLKELRDLWPDETYRLIQICD